MAQDIKKQPTVVEKKCPPIIEDASFYQDRTYEALKIKIDDASKNGKSNIYLEGELGYIVIQIWQNDYNKYGINFIIDKLKENGWKNL